LPPERGGAHDKAKTAVAMMSKGGRPCGDFVAVVFAKSPEPSSLHRVSTRIGAYPNPASAMDPRRQFSFAAASVALRAALGLRDCAAIAFSPR
jgi:acyl-coenzyme A synthetase/AMP-(fatty) acid ligase